MNRRALLTTLALAATTGLGGCGYSLRRPPAMAFESVTLSGFAPGSPMATELARALEATGVAVVENSAQAAARSGATGASSPGSAALLTTHITIEALSDRREQKRVATTSFAQVRLIDVVNSINLRVLRSDGTVLVGPTQMVQSSGMSYNESDALAKQYEAESVHRNLQTELVQQIMRRLAAIRPEQLKGPAAAAAEPASAPR